MKERPWKMISQGDPRYGKTILKDAQGNSVAVLSAAPESPITGQIYFDTSRDMVRIYDGSSWVDLGRAEEISSPRCRYCNQDTSEYDEKFASVCGACRDDAESQGVFFDLNDRPYRNGELGPWLVSECCYAYAKGYVDSIVCRSCLADTDMIDGPANVDTGDRFGRKPG